MLAGIQITEWDRNAWKWTVWGVGEQIGWELWELTTRQYYRRDTYTSAACHLCCGQHKLRTAILVWQHRRVGMFGPETFCILNGLFREATSISQRSFLARKHLGWSTAQLRYLTVI